MLLLLLIFFLASPVCFLVSFNKRVLPNGSEMIMVNGNSRKSEVLQVPRTNKILNIHIKKDWGMSQIKRSVWI